MRVPPGNILWRVDDLQFRELRAADNPTTTGAEAPTLPGVPAEQMRMVQAYLAPVTAASGDRARELLAELLAGRGLIFRAAAGAPAYGLPNERAASVGQVTSEGLRPILLDASFHAGLAQCGIE
ncbi:MAG: hypothetical protein ABW199_09880 [Caulobacterales bacterium]